MTPRSVRGGAGEGGRWEERETKRLTVLRLGQDGRQREAERERERGRERERQTDRERERQAAGGGVHLNTVHVMGMTV